MRIAFTVKGIDWDAKIDPRFGRTAYLLIWDDKENELTIFDNRAIENEAHGAGPRTSQKLIELKADVLVTGNGPGGNAAAVLEKAGIDVFVGADQMTVKEAYKNFQEKKLKRF
jgi:predicted Fe-Mo cluster-binding NifX family protein